LVSVTFTPAAAGTRTSSLVAVGSGGGGNPSSDFSGLGVAPSAAAVSIAPGQEQFGGVTVGSTSAARPVTVSNSGGATATISAIAIANGNSADFTVDSDDCTRTHDGQLDPGERCTVEVTFRPSAPGSRTAELDVTSDGGTPTAALIGTGID
jgi:hypothetical protein